MSAASADCRCEYNYLDKASIAAQLLQDKFSATYFLINPLLKRRYRHNQNFPFVFSFPIPIPNLTIIQSNPNNNPAFQVPKTTINRSTFPPVLLFLCAEILPTHADIDESLRCPVQEILDVFWEMKSINNLAETFLGDLDFDR